MSSTLAEKAFEQLDDEDELSAVWAVPVLAGLKPAGKCATSDRAVANRIEGLLLNSGLNTRRWTCAGSERHVLCFSREHDMLIELVESFLRRDRGREGLLLGYPRTAIEAFVAGTPLPYHAEPREMNEDWAMHFRLSPKNWRDEAAVLKTWNDEARQSVPGLFTRCVDWVRTIEFRRTPFRSTPRRY